MSSKEISHHNWAAIPLETLSPLLDRKLITGDGMMIAQVFLKKGCIVPRHQHHNEQLTYILQGGLRFFLGEEGEEERTQDVMAGEVLHIPAWKWHKAEALEDTLDVDIFSPPREDWINKTDSYLRGPTK
ncbi:MAG: cupin domain-containing protein [Gemmatimonadaceae bacterium]